ncbi:hypothetical protein [Psychrobacillus sp.]|uniref:hypothetical protein n=1 Tax=Psychrobacillus sp. TaxID=1871623 RepID=UPI0028BE412B|nr:hypothetical protein [Psychrobacillus sp.]
MIAVLLISTILSFSPVAYGETTSVQQSMDTVKMEMEQAALAYVDPTLKGELAPSSALYPLLNSVKKNYEATKKLILASNLSEKEKQAKLKELEALYEEKISKGLIPYIDAYNYATKYLEPLLKEIKEAEAKNDFLAVEKAYHKLSVQLKSRSSILYRFTGKAARDLLLEKYKNPADAKRDDLIIPVTIIMKAANVQQLLLEGKKEEAQKVIEEIQALAAKLSSTNPFHQALLKELKRIQAIVLPVPPVVPTSPPPTGGGGGGSSENSAQRALRLAKADAIKVLSGYKVDVKAGYSAANWAEIEKGKATGVIAINSAKTTTEVTLALANAKAAIDLIQVKSSISSVSEITVNGDLATKDAVDSKIYNVTLPAGTDKAIVNILATPTDTKAVIGQATTLNNGSTWQVVVTSEDGTTTTYTVNITVAANNAPTATNVTISGIVKAGYTLTGSYTYSDNEQDVEGTSLFKWYRANDASGTNTIEISGATSDKYTLKADDIGKYIFFGVTPVESVGETRGIEAISRPTIKVERGFEVTKFQYDRVKDELTIIGNGFDNLGDDGADITTKISGELYWRVSSTDAVRFFFGYFNPITKIDDNKIIMSNFELATTVESKQNLDYAQYIYAGDKEGYVIDRDGRKITIDFNVGVEILN